MKNIAHHHSVIPQKFNNPNASLYNQYNQQKQVYKKGQMPSGEKVKMQGEMGQNSDALGNS